MNVPTFGVHGGGGDTSGGLLSIIDSLLGGLTTAVDQGPSFHLFPGISALSSNVHPMIVHFPIALLTSYFLVDVYGSLRKNSALRLVARWLLYLGACGAVLAATAGLIAANTVPHGEEVHDIIETHETFGLTIAGLSTVLALWRLIGKERLSTMANSLQLLMGAILVTCIAFGADLGGLMVYQYGVGVHGAAPPDSHHHHHHESDESDV